METGYVRHTWDFGFCREIEEKHTGRYGAPGQRRQKKKKATQEEIKKQNQWKRERDVRRLILKNFKENDYWMTVTYRKGERQSPEEMKKDMARLIRSARKEYKDHGWELRYIIRMGIGERGAPHIHILANRKTDQETGTDLIFSKAWKKGHINFRHTYEEGGYRKLAEYITKPLEKWEPECLKSYTTSRNLIRVQPKERVLHRRSLTDSRGNPRFPKAPKGYYVDPDSVRTGINPVTGHLYRHYTIIKINRRI